MEIPAHRKAFGNRLRELRLARGWSSQEAFALHAGLDRTYVSGIESGRRNPTLDVAVRIAGALDVPLPELFSLVTLEMGTAARSEPRE
ncbi:helix-turn-helix transcriptional regulator [Leucobacter sp. USCH14]|uniref:helix-turn-helix transcriptional regulator n=1 Tax=Leucobacter sp. USCH14 TaxID=3024838 RepID=UPI00309E316E